MREQDAPAIRMGGSGFTLGSRQAREIAGQAREIADLKHAMDMLLARTSPEGRVAAR